MPLPVINVGDDHYSGGRFTPLKCYQVVVGASVVDLPTLLGEAVPEGANHMMFDPEGVVRVTFDGQNPNATTLGIRLNGFYEYFSNLFSDMKLVAGGSVTVNIHFFS